MVIKDWIWVSFEERGLDLSWFGVCYLYYVVARNGKFVGEADHKPPGDKPWSDLLVFALFEIGDEVVGLVVKKTSGWPSMVRVWLTWGFLFFVF